MIFLARLPACLALLAVLSGCAGDQTGSLMPPALPASTPRSTGLDRASEREHQRLVAAFGGEYRSPQAKALLSEVTAKLAMSAGKPEEAYAITLLDSPAINAFALPTGRIYVTRGLLALANDTAEIAAVLAHEIAHVQLRHAMARGEFEARSALVSRVVSDVLRDPAAGALVLTQSKVRLASFSRTQELEADEAGVTALAKAGYDPYGASRFLASLGRASGKGEAQPDMLSSHPATGDRIALVIQSARRYGAPGLGITDRPRYLAAVDGIAYGDNPTDGVVRGRRFIHPRLGVGFEAPEGMTLENGSRAVVGASADGNRRLLFDAIAANEGESLEAVLQSSWNDGVETSSIESLSVNGLPAAVAASKGKDWHFRLAAVRVNGTAFRLVMAAKGSGGDLDRVFRQTLATLHAVGPEEARSLRPLRVTVVTAGEGDTAETLAGRMAVPDRALERFLALNGLDRPAVKAGERYKVVTE